MIMPPSGTSHSTLPVSASKAWKRRLRSPQNSRSPAVVSAEPLPGHGCEWMRVISPVERLIFMMPTYSFSSMPGRWTPNRGPPPVGDLSLAVMFRQASWNGT